MSETINNENILDVSQPAAEKIAELIASRERDDLAVRVAIRGSLPGGGYQTEFKFMGLDEAGADDIVQRIGTVDFLFEPDVAQKIQGSRVDFDESRYSAGFNIEYPRESMYAPEAEPGKQWDDPIAQKVQTVIDEYINPGVAGHGGWVRLEDVREKQAYVEMGGGCQGCGLSAVTLRQGIETAILQAVPEIEGIIDMTEHEEGEQPYYSAEAAEAMGGASPFNQ
ncbi:MAG: iron-sulfur cluster assembly accessory protein [Chloroflexi bacterium]|nr:iron-sulfur cluster assembly accessory protein [Chloroflexota bacterium]